MSLKSKRTRTQHPLSCPDRIRDVLSSLQGQFPSLIPRQEKKLINFLQAVRYLQRYPDKDSKRGRPPKYKRSDLLNVEAYLSSILARETYGNTSVARFISHFLPLLKYPQDVVSALHDGDINLFEAEYLARLNEKSLETTSIEARRVRQQILRLHLASNGSQNALRSRVREYLNGSEPISPKDVSYLVSKTDELLEFNPGDEGHLFLEELKRLVYLALEVNPDDLDEELQKKLYGGIDMISNALTAASAKRKNGQM
jgi:hypothetical protein